MIKDPSVDHFCVILKEEVWGDQFRHEEIISWIDVLEDVNPRSATNLRDETKIKSAKLKNKPSKLST